MTSRIEKLESRLVLSSTPLITEFMASNSATLEDGDGNSSDWIEIHNPTTAAVSLDGWYLTDDADDLNKWAFPDISLTPNEYLIVFASAPDDGSGGVLDSYVDPGGNLHTNFKLSAGGEYLGLTMSDGLGGQTVVHDYGVEYPAQRTDISYGVDQNISIVDLVSPDTSTATAFVPTNGALDAPSPGQPPLWTLPGFNDAAWATSAPGGGTGVGYDTDDGGGNGGGGGSTPIDPNGGILPSLVGNDLTDPEGDGSLAGTISVGNANSPSGEEPDKALDNSVGEKWLAFSPTGTWYQFQFSGGPEVVSAYTISSANDHPERDPYSWTLSGSNNGSSFTVIDTRTAQDFTARDQTRIYGFDNTTSYQYYRFDFQTEFGATGNNFTGTMQLSEIELLSGLNPPSVVLPDGLLGNDLTDPEDDGSLTGTITVGNNNSPANEQPAQALDSSVATKWLSFAPTGTWYQFEFNSGAEAVGAYTITSANDAPQRDPYSWTLSGSNDGSNFTVVDTRMAENFTSRDQTRLYEFGNDTSYQYYRFDFQTEFGATGNNATGELQLAEIELFTGVTPANPPGVILPGGLVGNDLTDPEDDGSLAGVFTVGNTNSPGNETPAEALDNTDTTKWLSFAPAGTWAQFQFDAGPTLVNSYTITSANDATERDPYSWTLSGSDDGVNFTVVDTRNAQNFAGREETQQFQFQNSTPYEYYRFDFLTEFGVTGNNEPVAIQMAEIELLADGPISYDNLIDIDVESDWEANPTSVFERIEFPVSDPAAFSALLLNMQYNDGFVAYLNGVRVAEAAAPALVNYNSHATSERADNDAVVVQGFDISAHLGELVAGTNILAIQGLNVTDGSTDLLLRAGLVATEIVDEAFVPGYYGVPTPGDVNSDGQSGLVADPTFSVEHGFYETAFQLEISTPTSGAEIYYTTDGSEPTPTSGILYAGAIQIDSTSTLRAAAFQVDAISSLISTQTYIFINDVVSQDYASTLAAGFPTIWGGDTPDYGLDSQVIGNFDANGNSTGGDIFGGTYAATIKDDLVAIPTLSIVMDVDDMFGPNGIYSNPTSGGVAWERATSFELIDPNGGDDFQINAGIRIQGGAFRRDDLSKKHSLRLLFKGEYGATKLNYPFFGEDAADEFDTITLRMDSNDGYAWNSAGSQAQYARDEFGRRTQLDLGQHGSHGNRMHVYINGVYWGMYNPVERPDASFSASYYGGDKDNWDALNAGTVIDGTGDSWNTLVDLSQDVANASSESAKTAAYMLVQGKNPDGSDHLTAEDYLDVDNYIDYMLINFFGGNVDWPHRNWFASRERGPESTGYKFHIWDMESALGLISNINTNRTGVSTHVAEPYSDLRSSEEFRIRFADRAQRALFNEGALTEANAISRYEDILSEIEDSIVAESARWGDMHSSTPYTQAQWVNEGANVVNNFLTGRNAVLLNQLRAVGLFSSIDAPVFNQRGGQVTSGFDAVLTNPNGTGTIYYTTDGSDPRMIGGAVAGTASVYSGAIDITSATTLKARVLSGGQWSAIDEVAFTVAEPADATNLRITELNYNPHDAVLAQGELDVDNDKFEFIELRNVGAQEINLAGVQFVQVLVGGDNEGMEFTFSQQTLAPGEFVLVVNDQAAFESRYGTGLNVVGEYDGKLSNGGETLTLLDANDATIQQFAYDDAWESSTDGQGSSLVAIDVNGNYNSASNWRASAVQGGTPGVIESAAAGDFDSDQDVDGDDLTIWETGFGTSTGATVSNGDTDNDGDVDGADFLNWQRNFSPSVPVAAVATSATSVSAISSPVIFSTIAASSAESLVVADVVSTTQFEGAPLPSLTMGRSSYRSPVRESLAIDNVMSDYVSDSVVDNALASSVASAQSVSSRTPATSEQGPQEIAALRDGIFDEEDETEDLFDLGGELS